MSNRSFAVMVVAALSSAVAWADFSVDFSGYTEGEALSAKGASGGSWATTPPSAVNAPVGSVNAIAIDHDETGALTFGLNEGVPADRTSCDFAVAYEDVGDLAELSAEEEAFQFTLLHGTDGAPSFAVSAGGTWRLVSHPDVTPTTGVLYGLRAETVDMGGERYASLSVKTEAGYVRLADQYGAAWFALQTDKAAFSEIEFDGNGRFGSFAGADSGAEPTPVRDWVGEEEGDWTDAENWAGGEVPAAGEIARVPGRVELSGNGEATVEDFVARVGEAGALELLAGSFEVPVEFDTSRPRAGKALSVSVGSFGGLTRPLDSVAWWRGTARRAYDAEPFSDKASYKPTTDDYEHWFHTVVRRKGEVVIDREFFFSPLPVVYLTTDDGLTPTEAKEKHKGALFVQGNDEFKSTYDGKMEIKVRGNTTSMLPKKPWKIKLDKKAEMCGIAKSKHWVLLANFYDESEMRNKLAYDYANEIGSLGMKSDWVECVLNGQWQGLYQLCEHIRIDKSRVNIFNWEDEAETRGIEGGDEDFSWVTEQDDISGGYLIESSEEMDELSRFAIRPRDDFIFNIMVNSPEYLFTNQRMMDWLKDYFSGYYEAMIAPDGYSKSGLAMDEYADIDSMAAYFLVMEMFGNDDAAKKSRYFYKDRGKKVMFGPVWDFDWGVGNIGLVGSWPEGWKTCGHVCSFFRQWGDDPWFATRVHTLYWKVARPKFLAILGEDGLIAGYKKKLSAPAAVNDVLWQNKRGLSADADALNDYLTQRLAWLDKQFADVPTLMDSVKAYSWASDTHSATPYTRDGATLPIAFANLPDSGRLAPGAPLRLAMSVGAGVARVGVYANGRKVGDPVTVLGGRIEVDIPARMLTTAKGEENCISLVAFDGSGAVVARNYRNVTVAPPLVLLLR